MARIYEGLWDRILKDGTAEEPKPVKIAVRVPKNSKETVEILAARIKKAVWKEKERCNKTAPSGTKLKELWRLECELDFTAEKKQMIFKLVRTTHPENI